MTSVSPTPPENAMKCPRCESPRPTSHPAVQFEGEVQICPDPFHASTPDGRAMLAQAAGRSSVSPTPKDTEAERRAGGVIGYVLAMNYAETSNPELKPKGWQVDWDGEVHPTWGSAFRECLKANGEAWRDAVADEGLTPYLINAADYLPYALTLVTENPAAVLAASPAVTGPGEALDAFEFTMPKGPYAATRLDPAPPAVTEGEREPEWHHARWVDPHPPAPTGEPHWLHGHWAIKCASCGESLLDRPSASPAVTAAEDEK